MIYRAILLTLSLSLTGCVTSTAASVATDAVIAVAKIPIKIVAAAVGAAAGTAAGLANDDMVQVTAEYEPIFAPGTDHATTLGQLGQYKWQAMAINQNVPMG